MNDSLFDDVTALLDGDFGDDRILKQISRACKNNEVISNYERNYVQKLAEQYLGKKPDILPSENSTPTVPDVIMPKIELVTQTQAFESKSSNNSNFNLKNSKLILGFGSIALIIVIAGAILLSSNTDSFPSNPTPEIKTTLLVQTDSSSYDKKDLISINGMSQTSEAVNISIENQNNQLVWAEQIPVKNNNNYSTLAIAGGPGWENSGTYTVKVDNGLEVKSITFSFNS